MDIATAGSDDACVGEHYKLRVAADSFAFGKGGARRGIAQRRESTLCVRECVINLRGARQNYIEIAVQHIVKSQRNKYTANNAENSIRADKALIIS